ncbi:PTS system mannose/fructose/sorbose family transporter subunit IID [Thermophilibacter sp.]
MNTTATIPAQTDAESGKRLSKKDLRSIFWRSCMLDGSWNYERQQHLAYSFSMTPVIKKLYEPGSDKQRRAYERSLDFMAVTPQLSTFLMGIDAAMEEEEAASDDFDGQAIASVKTSLMGPLAGIGDSLIASTWRIIATSIAIGFSQQGSVLGPILLLLIFNIPAFVIRWFGLKFGYQYGASFITKAAKSGVMEKISYAAAIVGLMAIGGMVASYVTFDVSTVMIGAGDFAEPLSTYLDMVMPCMLPLLVFGFMYWILGKKIKTTTVLIWTIVVCIAACGILSLF